MSYETTQEKQDKEWREAWKNLPPEERKRIEDGLKAASEYPVQMVRHKVGVNGHAHIQSFVLHETATAFAAEDGRNAVGRDEDAVLMASRHRDFSTDSNMESLDTHADELMEKHGLRADVARAIAEDCAEKVRRASTEVKAEQLARIVGFLLSGNENPLAKLHALMHAIPSMARLNNVRSLRHSAEICKEAGVAVSVEWISRLREKWCAMLQIPVPAESTKSAEAIAKYTDNAKKNHFRKKICKTQIQPTQPPKP